MSKFAKNLRGFTLVEVLIVIVIVGILIAALLPRLQGSQARARDVARKGHVQQIATAYGIYNQDNAQYPATGTCVGTGQTEIVDYMSSVPQDPQSSNVTPRAGASDCQGQYAYLPLNGGEGGLVYAALETEDAGGNFDWGSFSGSTTITGAQAAVCGGGGGDCPSGTQYFAIIMR